MIAAGADINLLSPQGETPLGAAATSGNTAALEALFHAGADPNHEWNDIRALSCAAVNGQDKAVSFLLHSGADPSWRSSKGLTALEEAEGAEQWSCAQLIRQHIHLKDLEYPPASRRSSRI